MLDQGKLRKKVLLGLFTSPVTLVPFILGTTLLAAALAFSHEPGIMAFGGLVGVLGAAGILVTRLLLGTEGLTQEAIEALRQETLDEQEQRLDQLDHRLIGDEDPRSEAALRDLRAFEQAFRNRSTWAGKLNAASLFEIVSSVQDLFGGCVSSLETSFDLWETADGLKTPSARRPILERREEIIRDVQTSIEQLSRILVGIQRLGSGDQSDSELSRVRAELDESLAVAKKVEDKIRTWQEQSFDFE